MVDWIHCNKCYKQPGGSLKFLLTNCGHLFCEGCLKKDDKTNCKVCNKQCNTIPLSSQMKPDVQLYFRDPSDLLSKHMQEVLQVINFQKEHRQKLTAKNRDRLGKFSELYDEYIKVTNMYKELEKENRMLKSENTYLKKILNQKGFSIARAPQVPTPGSASSTSSTLFGSGFATPPSQNVSNLYNINSAEKSGGYCSTPTSMVGRISIRTPPVNGRMGYIPGRVSPYSSSGSNISRLSTSSLYKLPSQTFEPSK